MIRTSFLVLAVTALLCAPLNVFAAEGDVVNGTVTSVDSANNKINIAVDGEEADIKSYDVTSGVTITVDGKTRRLVDVKPGSEVWLTLSSDDESTVIAIAAGTGITWWIVLAGLAVAIIASIFIGQYAAKSMRMAEYDMKIALVLAPLSCAIIIVATGWPPRLGVDLQGGVTLIYEIKQPEDGERISAAIVAEQLKPRVNPGGTKEVIIRPFGEDRIEIIVPNVGQAEVENIKRAVTQAGHLRFRIVAERVKHADTIARARDRSQFGKTVVVDEDGRPIGRWVNVMRDSKPKRGIYRFKTQVWSDVIRDKQTKEEIRISDQREFGENFEEYLEKAYQHPDGTKGGITDIEVLMHTDDGIELQGIHLGSVRSSFDSRANPSIDFSPNAVGAINFRALTSENMPEQGRPQRLGIVLDDDLISAPNIQGVISDRGQITGSFTRQEVDYLVGILRAGKLDAALKEQPLSEDRIDSDLGEQMRSQGIMAIGVSMCLVLVFMGFYYRFAGIIACLALLMNLVLIVALVILIKQPFTLTGLAGLVLTVGMSVDANVLIFERIREEIDRGSTLRMAIRNGFSRATTTIVDANLTTLITAIVLYTIGTDQIRGFAVALILGILMSMYTAIFCSRVIFDIGERQRWITKLSMMRLLGTVQFDFIGKRTGAIATSLMLIVIGLFAVVYRGEGIFDIDLAGGTSVRAVFDREKVKEEFGDQPIDAEFVRQRVAEVLEPIRINGAKIAYRVAAVTTGLDDGSDKDVVYRIDTSIPEPPPMDPETEKEAKRLIAQLSKDTSAETQDETMVALGQMARRVRRLLDDELNNTKDEKTRARIGQLLEENPTLADIVKKAFKTESGTLLAMNSLVFPELKVRADEPDVPSKKTNGGEPDKDDDENASKPKSTDGAQFKSPTDSFVTFLSAPQDDPAASKAKDDGENKNDDRPASDAKKSDVEESKTNQDLATDASGDDSDMDQDSDEEGNGKKIERVKVTTKLSFRYPIESEALSKEIQETANEGLGIKYLSDDDIALKSVGKPAANTSAFTTWELELNADKSDASAILNRLKSDTDGNPYFRGQSGVGGQIARDTQVRAMAALLASLLGIVIYIWIRFQRVVFGLAAVVALIHDVLFVLGAIAVSYWLAGVFGFLLIDEFKISLPVVAAFLTVIGYSLNDTIVVFDRIREVRGKSPELTGDMINRSIGQTLSRTVLTSITTLIVVVILYWGGGEAIHGFAFALVVGVLVGTYSSIFVASPVLLWMSEAGQESKEKPA